MIRGQHRKECVLGITLGLLMAMAGCGGGGGGGTTLPPPNDNPAPTVSGISPTSATAGAAAGTLTITGTNFLSTSTVTYNGVGHTATFVSASELTISLTTSDQAAAGTYPVVVTNPAPGGGNSTAVNFTVNNLAPTISSLSPTSATAGAAEQTLAINGTNFLSTSTVTFNNLGHTAAFVSATKLTISLSASDQATAGSYPVVVTNPAPGGGASKSVDFTVNPASTVKISITSPSNPAAVTVGQQLSIKASVTGTTNTAVSWTVTGDLAGTIPNGNSLLGTIPGTSTSATYTAPSVIPGGNNPVTITATSQADESQSASITVTIDPSTTTPTEVTVSGGDATGINFTLSTMTTTLGLADVGTCVVSGGSTSCSAGEGGVQVSQSGAKTSSCPNATCTIWLVGRSLTDSAGDTLASGLTVNVTHGSTADVTVSGVTPFPNYCTASGQAADCGSTAIYFNIKVSSTQALGIRAIVVTVGSGSTKETQEYFGGIQIVN
ncbi:MAG: IPT/TIG domain-containing protein [Terriglobia bacterium]